MALSALQVAVLRFVDPPTSAFMLARQGEAWRQGGWGFRVAYDWRDLEDISRYLPMAVIAAEDQNFASHSGFDLKAIEKLMLKIVNQNQTFVRRKDRNETALAPNDEVEILTPRQGG